MEDSLKTQQKILIADDSELKRELLIDMLGNEFDTVEVEDGNQAVALLQERASEFSMLLLDIVMPEMGGFQVLEFMNQNRLIDEIPVIMLSAETDTATIEKAYDMGVTDFISYPFDALIVRRRVENTMILSAKQRRMMDIVAEQIYEKEHNSKLMLSILSHIVETHNGESGQHVMHINVLTEMFLRELMKKTNRYKLSRNDMNLIVQASSLHDIGKIAIPGEILNKPGRLTDEEFAIMKLHSQLGADMLGEIQKGQKSEPLIEIAYEICRWHHERYDGRGYPDGLKGDEIPISAQIVALADVYDALTSERCYKPAYSHEQAIDMILGGQCGAFNPLLMECLQEIADKLKEEIQGGGDSQAELEKWERRHLIEQLRSYELTGAERQLWQIESDKQQFLFLTSKALAPVFQYKTSPPTLNINDYSAKLFGMDRSTKNPIDHSDIQHYMENESVAQLREKIKAASPENPDVTQELTLTINGETHRFCCDVRTFWADQNAENYYCVLGMMRDIGRE